MNRSTLWDWMQEVDMEAGEDYRRDVFILQLNRGKIPLRMFMLRGAFPVRWTNANLDAGSSAAAVEELELTYQDLEVNVVPLPF
jgi:phage tail-like protein